MTLDLVAMAGIAISAVLMIDFLAELLGTTRRGRVWARVLLGGWFVGVLAVGGSHLIAGGGPGRAGGLGLLVVVPLAILCAVTFLSASRRARVAQADLRALVWMQVMRMEGIIFVLLYAVHRLPAPFAPTAGWGDVLVGVLAIPLSVALGSGRGGRGPLAVWTVLGMTDLVTALTLGTLSAPSPFQVFHNAPGSGIMPTLPWILIPCFMVPCFFFLHVVTIARMRSGVGIEVGGAPGLEPGIA